MVSESLARRFKPAGFDQPEGLRQSYVRPRPELKEAFDKWVEELPKKDLTYDMAGIQYQIACRLIEPFGEIPYKEANGLLVGFEPRRIEQESDAGLFISACFNQSPEPVIIFDVDASEVDCIGYRLEKSKILVNEGMAGHYLGWWNSGIILNNGIVGDNFGIQSCGITINNGKAGYFFGSTSYGDNIALKWPTGYGSDGPAPIKPEDLRKIPRLRTYLEEFVEASKNLKTEELARNLIDKYSVETMHKQIQAFRDEAWRNRL